MRASGDPKSPLRPARARPFGQDLVRLGGKFESSDSRRRLDQFWHRPVGANEVRRPTTRRGGSQGVSVPAEPV